MEDQAIVTIDTQHGNKRVGVNGTDVTRFVAALQLNMDAAHATLTVQLNPDASITDLPCHVQQVTNHDPLVVITEFLDAIDPEFLSKEVLERLGTIENGNEIDPIAGALLVLKELAHGAARS